MFHKKAIILISILFYSGLFYAQCGFDNKRTELQKDPSYVAFEKAAELRIQQAIKKRKTQAKNNSSSVLNIPVVVHVLHLGEAEGSGSNISDAQIQSSINNLNDFYRGQTANSPVDFEIEFTLAQRDPSCNATDGINRINASSLTGYSANGVNVNNNDGADYDDIKNLISWPQTDYFNVWVVTELDNNGGGSGFQGYAYFYNDTGNHGSVMMSSVFGYDPGNTNGWGLNSNGDNSTVVHEIGHYFHLYHTFQGDDADSDGVADRCPDDAVVGEQSDGCADTETHQRAFNCPVTNSCSNSNWIDNNTINNIMSYYNCTDRLTADQKTRVRAAMEGTAIVSSKGANVPDPSYTAPVAACSTNATSTNAAGITSVALNDVTFTSFSSASDGGNIDNTVSCSNYFEIDASVANTLEVGMFTVNFQQLGVWIDWNDDGDFEDDNEQQYLVNQGIVENTTVSVPLIYPTSIPYEDYVRIRLVTDIDERYTGATAITSACTTTLYRGQSEDYTIYVKPAQASNWTGTTNTDWATATNWSSGSVPTASDNVDIPSAPANQPIIGASTGASVNNVTIEGSLNIANGGSLKVAGTSTGNITYNLAILDTNWHLVSSPVVGEEYNNDWITANSIALGSGNNRAISTYDNGSPDIDTDDGGPDTATDHWRYFQASNNPVTFTSGIGYSNKRTASGNYNFTGTFPTTDITPAISQSTNNWNLLGNPYPSYINIATFLTENTNKLAAAYNAVYVWNGTNYTDLTTGYIHPGQGFFVHADVALDVATFTEAMQSHQTGVTFYKNNNPNIQLLISNGKATKTTEVSFEDGKTLGLDSGFDIGLFDGVATNLSVYSHLVRNNEGISFQKQSLPLNKITFTTIPLGIKADANKELTFSIKSENLPSNIKVYLEDKFTEKLILLSSNKEDYKITPSEKLNGTGRFYLHTSSTVLNIDNFNTELLSIFKKDKTTIRITGVKGNTTIKLYNIQGKEILQSFFNAEGFKDFSVMNITTGIYIVTVQTENSILKKKIILE